MSRIERNRKSKKNKKGLKIVGIIFLIIIIIIAGIAVGGYSYIAEKLGKMKQVQINEEDLNINSEVAENLAKFRNIAIFCIDSREDDYGKGNRSDGIIVASLNNETKEINLISVYRDSYLQIEGHGLDKATHAYSYGEAPLAINMLNSNLDLNIKEFVAVNFDAVAEAVNALGGIEMDVTAEEMEIMNVNYILATQQSTGLKSDFIKRAGVQTLDGVQAVSYCRVRYTEGGDYKRTERIRNVLMKIVEKLKTRSIGEINNFLDKTLPRIYTNIPANNIISMVPSALNFKFNGSMGWPYEVRGYTNPTWYGAPVTLESNVVKLHQEVFGEEDYEPTESVKNISNKIIKTTGYSK